MTAQSTRFMITDSEEIRVTHPNTLSACDQRWMKRRMKSKGMS
jgi:hypothetical protein